MTKKRIAIIGGGITGLSAAFYLQKELKENHIDAEFTLYEGSAKLGGKIDTDYSNGFVMELGPDSFLARKQSAAQLAKEVGLGDELVYNTSGKSYILHEGHLYPMPGGAIMGIPTQWGPFLSTKLFSPVGKARAAGDLFLPKVMKNNEDVSLGTFFRRRLGNEVVERLIEPLLSGIYAGNIDRLSLKATFPHFQQIEAKYGSLIVGMKSSIAKRESSAPKENKGKPRGMFLSFKRGLQSLVDAVEQQLDDGTVKKNAKLTEFQKKDDKYTLSFEDGTTDVVDYVVLATPHHITHKVLEQHTFAKYLGQIPSTSVATIVLGFPKSAIKKDIDGSGFVVSKKTDYSITACTWTHRKWEHSTPAGFALLRGYVGRAGDDAIVSQSDEEIVDAVLKDLGNIMEISGDPEFYKVTRWKKAMPQYEVGHTTKLEEVTAGLKTELPGVFLAGGSYKGIGIPDCIDQGKHAVTEIISLIRNKD